MPSVEEESLSIGFGWVNPSLQIGKVNPRVTSLTKRYIGLVWFLTADELYIGGMREKQG